MKKIIHTCDRCGKTGSNEEVQLSVIAVGILYGTYHETLSTYDSAHKQDWCHQCVVEVFKCTPTRDEKPASEHKYTLEELIREIVKQEIEDAS